MEGADRKAIGGYDIRSFDPDGAERFIEVKTTRGGPRTDFFLSRNERAFSQKEPERFRLYRLYDFGSAPAADATTERAVAR